MLTIPPHIDASGFRGEPIRFKETVKALDAAARRDAPKIGGMLYSSTNQCALAFSAATIEWIAWRLDGVWNMRTLLDFAEALWAAQVHPAYAKQVKPPQPGNALASHYVYEVWNSGNAQRKKLAAGKSDNLLCCNLAQIAKFVAPSAKPLNAWTKKVLERLHALHPVDDVAREDRLLCNGPAIPRVAMDTTQEYDPATRDDALASFIAGLDPDQNPFLATADEMTAAGFTGTPYAL